VCLWVNGDNYSFSDDVLDKGNKLYKKFCDLIILLKVSYTSAMDDYFYENFNTIKNNLKQGLEEFDNEWVSYENVCILYNSISNIIYIIFTHNY